MGSAPTVSVIVPCYNGGHYIDGLLGSLRAQTLQNFEVIVIDDGSGPETQDKLATLDSSIRVIRQANAGPGAARNTGMRAARGAFFLPVDCDDYLAPTYIEETLGVLRADPQAGIAFTALKAFDAIDQEFPRRFHPFEILFSNRLQACMLMRRSVWEKLGGYDAAMRDGYEDWDFNIRMSHAGVKGAYLPKPLYFYRVNANGMLLSHCTQRHAAIWRYIRSKNAAAYTLPAIMKTWRTTGGTSHMPLPVALAMLALAQLPNAAFTMVMNTYRYARLAVQGWRSRMQGV